MRDYLLFIVKNALRSKRRALLTMASVALSFCLLAVLMALYRALFLSAPATPGQALRLVAIGVMPAKTIAAMDRAGARRHQQRPPVIFV